MAYATIAEMIDRYDERVLKDLVQDDDTRNADLTGNPILEAILDDGTALIDAAIRRTYSNDQLAVLATANSAVLRRLNCDLAMGLLYQRRARGLPDQIREVFDEAKDMLREIREGKSILDDDAARAAAIAAPHRVSETDSRKDWPLTNSALYPDFRRDNG